MSGRAPTIAGHARRSRRSARRAARRRQRGRARVVRDATRAQCGVYVAPSAPATRAAFVEPRRRRARRGRRAESPSSRDALDLAAAAALTCTSLRAKSSVPPCTYFASMPSSRSDVAERDHRVAGARGAGDRARHGRVAPRPRRRSGDRAPRPSRRCVPTRQSRRPTARAPPLRSVRSRRSSSRAVHSPVKPPPTMATSTSRCSRSAGRGVTGAGQRRPPQRVRGLH